MAMPPMMMPRVAGPPPGGGLPGSPVGGPGGPGATPMLSPGQGAGLKAASVAKIKAAMRAILIEATHLDPGKIGRASCRERV